LCSHCGCPGPLLGSLAVAAWVAEVAGGALAGVSMSPGRVAAAVGVVAALAIALVVILVQDRSSETEPPQAAPTEAPDEISPGSTPTPSPSPKPVAPPSREPVAVPTPNTKGRDFDRIFREINDFRDWLYAHPDPELVGLIYHPQCECYERARKTLRSLRGKGVHFEEEGFEVQKIEVTEEFEPVVRLEVILRAKPAVIVDESGQVVREAQGAPPTLYSFALVKGGGERWFVRTITNLGEA
jgi:hypothetical protein